LFKIREQQKTQRARGRQNNKSVGVIRFLGKKKSSAPTKPTISCRGFEKEFRQSGGKREEAKKMIALQFSLSEKLDSRREKRGRYRVDGGKKKRGGDFVD